MSILNSFVEYNRIYWKNKKAGGTPTGATNFNIMDKGIKANNDAIKELNDVKLDKTETANKASCLVEYDTRDNDLTPLQYIQKGMGTYSEFKTYNYVGKTSGYFNITTIVPYLDNTGGYPVQIANGNDLFMRRVGISDNAWSEWTEMASVPTKKVYVFTRTTDETYINSGGINASTYNGVLYLNVNISTVKTIGEWGRVEIGQFSDWDLGTIYYNESGVVGNLAGNYAYLEIDADGKVYFITHNASATTGWVYANITRLVV